MHLSDVHLRAENIRNVHSRERTYPSDIRLEAGVLDSGRLRVDGNADFLAVPHAGVKATCDLDGMDVAYLEPLLRDYDLVVRKGALSARGTIAYAPTVKNVEDDQLASGAALLRSPFGVDGDLPLARDRDAVDVDQLAAEPTGDDE